MAARQTDRKADGQLNQGEINLSTQNGQDKLHTICTNMYWIRCTRTASPSPSWWGHSDGSVIVQLCWMSWAPGPAVCFPHHCDSKIDQSIPKEIKFYTHNTTKKIIFIEKIIMLWTWILIRFLFVSPFIVLNYLDVLDFIFFFYVLWPWGYFNSIGVADLRSLKPTTSSCYGAV